jgi:hypothetical protein
MPPDSPTNGAAEPQPKSLRDAAEAAWDSVVEDAPAEDQQPPVDGDDRPRDAQGRFAPRTAEAPPTGEAEPDGSQRPADDQQAPPGDKQVPPAPQGSSREPPKHWAEHDRQLFARLEPEGQDFLLRRHTEMERFAQDRVQAAATAVQFTNALAPYFQDPVVAGSMQQEGLTPFDAITQLLAFHRRAVDPNPQVRQALYQELGQRLGLNPAANGQTMSPQGVLGLSEQDLKDPVIKQFAEYFGRTQQEMQAQRAMLNQIVQQTVNQQTQQAVEQSRWTIEQFAAAKDQQGNLLHPFLDHPEVIGELIEKFRMNPDRDLQQTYERAVWAVPELRTLMLDAGRQSATRQQANERARLAVRGNVRGITSPVSKPQADQGSQGLRGTIEAAADELGI